MTSLKTAVSKPYKAVLARTPPALALRVEYYRRLRRFPNLRNPTLFTEKSQVAKLTDRNPLLPIMVDKVRVKDFVSERLGPDWVTPTIWHGPELPARADHDWPLPFVIKVNHVSGGNFFVRTPEECDWPTIENAVNALLSRPYEPHTVQWAYNSIPRQALVEPYIGDVAAAPVDYKLFVFHGRVEFIEVDTDRATQHKRAFYDRAWKLQPFALQYPLETRPIPRPKSLNEMIAAAELLAGAAPFLRIDFYEISGQPLFGEISQFPDGGMGRFDPPAYDKVLGDLWR